MKTQVESQRREQGAPCTHYQKRLQGARGDSGGSVSREEGPSPEDTAVLQHGLNREQKLADGYTGNSPPEEKALACLSGPEVSKSTDLKTQLISLAKWTKSGMLHHSTAESTLSSSVRGMFTKIAQTPNHRQRPSECRRAETAQCALWPCWGVYQISKTERQQETTPPPNIWKFSDCHVSLTCLSSLCQRRNDSANQKIF